jgi:predicted esterase
MQSFQKSLSKALVDLDEFITKDGPYDGAIAFSQGGVLVATYLIQKARLYPHEPLPFKCAIFLSGGIPWDPHSLGNDYIAPRQLRAETDGNTILAGFPTAHIWGRNDESWPGTSEVLCQLCDPMLRNEFIHDEGHAIPTASARDTVLGSVRVIRRTVQAAENLSRG